MAKKTKTDTDLGDQRSPDQDAALEAAFVAGTLPEDDRREDVHVAASPFPVVEHWTALSGTVNRPTAQPVVEPTKPE